MRTLLVLLFTLLTTPAFAQGLDRYENGRFGYGIDIPPGFSGAGESDNGDGQEFSANGRAISLLVWGSNIVEGDFESEVLTGMAYAEEEAWNITYQATTPRWASFSGLKGFRVLYQRMVLLCDGSNYAAFRAEYSVADTTEMDPVIERLVRSLRVAGC